MATATSSLQVCGRPHSCFTSFKEANLAIQPFSEACTFPSTQHILCFAAVWKEGGGLDWLQGPAAPISAPLLWLPSRGPASISQCLLVHFQGIQVWEISSDSVGAHADGPREQGLVGAFNKA